MISQPDDTMNFTLRSAHRFTLITTVLVLTIAVAIPTHAQDTEPVNCSMINDGLTGYWSFESSDNKKAVDESGHGNHGRINDASVVERGKVGNALYFDGYRDYVAFEPTQSIRPSLPMTASFWVKMHSLPSLMGHNVKFLSWKIRGRQTGWHISSVKNNNFLQTLSGDGESFHQLKSNDPMQKDRWYHVAFRRTKDGGSLFIDGHKTNVDYDRVKLPDKQFLGLRIGGWDHRHSLNGLMDEVRLYKKGLSDDAIKLLSEGDCAE